MSRRELKMRAKSQIRGNVIILWIMGVIAGIDRWFQSISSSTAIASSGVAVTFFSMLFALRGPVYLSNGRNVIVNPSISRLSQQFSQQYSSISGSLLTCSIIVMILHFVVVPALRVSLSRTYLGLAREEKPKFAGFKFGFKDCWEQSVVLNFLMGLFLFLWYLLFIIPGIIKSYSYSMAYYILADNPDMNGLDAITKSRKLMRGHKFELFILDISFFFWYLLAFITFGLANIYIRPYIESAKANFYLKIKQSCAEDEE